MTINNFLKIFVFSIFVFGFFGFIGLQSVEALANCNTQTNSLDQKIQAGTLDCESNPSECQFECGLGCSVCENGCNGLGERDLDYQCVDARFAPCSKRLPDGLARSSGDRVVCDNPSVGVQGSCKEHCELPGAFYECVYTSVTNGGPTCSDKATSAPVDPCNALVESRVPNSRSSCSAGSTQVVCIGYCQEDSNCSFNRNTNVCETRKDPLETLGVDRENLTPVQPESPRSQAESKKTEPGLPANVVSQVRALNQLPTNLTLEGLIGRALGVIIGLLGTIALIMFAYSGVLWMIGTGSPERTGKALKTLMWSSIGLLVILASYALLTFIFGAI